MNQEGSTMELKSWRKSEVRFPWHRWKDWCWLRVGKSTPKRARLKTEVLGREREKMDNYFLMAPHFPIIGR